MNSMIGSAHLRNLKKAKSGCKKNCENDIYQA